MQRFFGGHALGRVGCLFLFDFALALEVRDELLERVLGTVEHKVIGELAFFVGDFAVRSDVVRVDHCKVKSSLDSVVQED